MLRLALLLSLASPATLPLTTSRADGSAAVSHDTSCALSGTAERTREIIATEIGVELSSSDDAFTLRELGAHDSDIALIVTELEMEFDITILDEDVTLDTTLSDVCKLVESLVD